VRVIQAEVDAETQRAIAEVSGASLQRLERERERIAQKEEEERELLEARHAQVLQQRDEALRELERQWAEEDARAVGEVRQRLSEEARRKSAAVAQELRELASIPTEVLRSDFARWLAASAQEVAGVVVATRAEEVARLKWRGEEEEASAIMALEAEIAGENEERVLRLVSECEAQRGEAIARMQAEAKEGMRAERAKLDAEQAARLSAALEQVRAKLAAQAREDERTAMAAAREETEEGVRAARERVEEEGKAALLEASRQFEQALQAELVRLHTECTAAHDAAVQARQAELARAREEQVEAVRSEMASKTSKALRQLQEQTAGERERRIQAMQRSCQAELERRTLEVEGKAQAELEHALGNCRAEGARRCEAALLEAKTAGQADVERVVGELRESQRGAHDRAARDLQAKYDAERTAAVDALERQLSADLAARLEASRVASEQARESQVRELEERARQELAAALEALKADKAAECAAALAAVHAEVESRGQRELQALEEQMARRKAEAISAVEAECRGRFVEETDKMNEAFAASRDAKVRSLKTELQQDLQAQMENKQLRAELELARQLSALRAECVADLERCRGLVAGRNSQAAQKLIAVLRLKHRKESEAHMAAGERSARRHNEEVMRELRGEWRLVRELFTASHSDARPSSQALDEFVGMRIQLEAAIWQVDELQGLLSLVAAGAGATGAGARALSSTRAAAHPLASTLVGSQHDAVAPPSPGARRGQVKRALHYPAAAGEPEWGGRGAEGDTSLAGLEPSRDCAAGGSAGEVEGQEECDLSMRSTLPAGTPCKSTTSSVASSTPACTHHSEQPGNVLDLSCTSSPMQDSSKVDACYSTPHKSDGSPWASPPVQDWDGAGVGLPGSARLPVKGRAGGGDPSPVWRAKYVDVSPIKQPRSALTRSARPSARGVVDSADSLEGVGGVGGGRSAAAVACRRDDDGGDDDSEDSLDEQPREKTHLRESGAPKATDSRQKPLPAMQPQTGSPSQVLVAACMGFARVRARVRVRVRARARVRVLRLRELTCCACDAGKGPAAVFAPAPQQHAPQPRQDLLFLFPSAALSRVEREGRKWLIVISLDVRLRRSLFMEAFLS